MIIAQRQPADHAEKARSNRFAEIGPGLALLALAVVVGFAPVVVAALAALGFIVVAALAPVPALALVVLSVPFSPLSRPVGHYSFSPTETFIVLTTAGCILRIIAAASPHPLSPSPTLLERGDQRASLVGSPPPAGRPRGRERGPGGQATPASGTHPKSKLGDPVLAILVGLLVLTGAVSLTTSAALHQSLESFRLIIVEPAVFYLLVVREARGRRDLALLALALVVAGVAISLVGGWQYLTNERIITAEAGLRRIRAFYGSPNNLGLFLGRALPMGFGLALFWTGGRRWLALASLVMAVALVLTFSIGAWFAVVPSLLLVALLRGRRTFLLGLEIGVIGLIGLGVAALKVPRIGSHFDLAAGTSFIRLNVWESALRMIADHPVRGVGLDNFLYYYNHGYRLPTAWQDPDMSHPHNLVLDFWLSLGLPGLVLLGALVVRFVELIASRWKSSDIFARGLYAGAAGALADTILHGLVDNSFFLPDLAVLFWLIFGIVSLLSYKSPVKG